MREETNIHETTSERRTAIYHDRPDAGRVLARHLVAEASRPRAIALGLPRGGVPVAAEVARALQIPLDVLLVRKLGVPGHEELAMGALASGGIRVLNPDIVSEVGVDAGALETVIARETAELARREARYRGSRPPPALAGANVLLIDDGLATGATMLAAVTAVRRQQPARIVVAVPVAAPATCATLQSAVGAVICPVAMEPLRAVGAWYQDFSPTTDDDVCRLLAAGLNFGALSGTTGAITL